MTKTRRAALLLGGPVLSLALAGGVAAAAFQPLEHAAAAHPERVERPKPPLPKLEEVLDRLVLEGTLSATQRDAILAAVRKTASGPASGPASKERTPEAAEKKKQQELKRAEEKKRELDGKKTEQKARIDVHRLLGDSLRSAVAYLGLDRRAVQEQVRSGKSLADIAAATPARSTEGLLAAIGAPANTKLDELRAQGKLTEEQVSKLKQQIAAAAAKIADAKSVRKVTPPGQDKKRT